MNTFAILNNYPITYPCTNILKGFHSFENIEDNYVNLKIN